MSPSKKSRIAGRLAVRQVKSGIGFNATQKATLKALGLGRIGKRRVHPDNPQIRGMIKRVDHLVQVERAEVDGGGR